MLLPEVINCQLGWYLRFPQLNFVNFGSFSNTFCSIRSGSRSLNVPKTLTCHVLSADMLKAVNDMLLYEDDVPKQIGQSISQPFHASVDERRLPSLCGTDNESSLVLAGLHACGDLSVTMLR